MIILGTGGEERQTTCVIGSGDIDPVDFTGAAGSPATANIAGAELIRTFGEIKHADGPIGAWGNLHGGKVLGTSKASGPNALGSTGRGILL